MNKLIISITTVTFLIGCSTQPNSADIALEQLEAQQRKNQAAQEKTEIFIEQVPRWVLNPPASDETGIYGVGIGQSKQLNFALQKANLSAQYELAKSIAQQLSGSEQSYAQDRLVDSTEQYTQLIDSLVAEVPLQGFETIDQKVAVLEGEITFYKLLKLPHEQMIKVLSSKSTTNDKQKEINKAFEMLQHRLSEENIQEAQASIGVEAW
ncbi:hypothetical protein QF117_13335 [Vibrio sp. YMD68]|uniref:hypothetical protein n=1 Tax=Vibrio sp. YMD68 TaxID=3042300 RepID=UPI00249BBCDC|nr:hypothetical protein [Vibrio sp. YMD68]WGW01754.1 hypothetical protein QF117_13335 [Vibrio sp. YMD68]